MTAWPRLGVLAALAVAGCAAVPKLVIPPTPAPPVVAAAPVLAPPPPVVRPVPAPVSCIGRSFPRAPRYPDTDEALRAAPGAADRYQLMAAGRLMRERRLAEVERAIEVCRRVGP